MKEIINFITSNYYIIIAIYLIVFVLLIILFYKFKHSYIGTFSEANIFRKLKKIYKKYDYPYIKEIILPINKESYAYYDAIVFGDKFIYLIEIKNHHGDILIDPLDDWVYVESSNKQHPFINPFYELELKKHIINRFLEININRIIEIVVYNTKTKPQGSKGKNHLIAANQLNSIIKHYESRENIPKFSPDLIEDKGNYLLEINIKKKKIRRKVINDLRNQRTKR
ncbi:NERD domain-containing protein [Erysipelotrichaceae bacterium OttesenSCG-928-M19]|nr:NERD domain-containing protein [Erysipelotrichaceae bacterium OttesenSCG-928-M19]